MKIQRTSLIYKIASLFSEEDASFEEETNTALLLFLCFTNIFCISVLVLCFILGVYMIGCVALMITGLSVFPAVGISFATGLAIVSALSIAAFSAHTFLSRSKETIS